MQSIRYIVTVLLFFIPCAHAMELEVQKRENPFNMLPLELRGRIIKDVFNLIIHEDKRVKPCVDQKKLEEHTLKVPMFLGLQCIQEFRELQKICQNKIGNKTMRPDLLFVMDRKYRDIFIRMANRSGFRSEFEGNVSRDDFKAIMAMENNDIKKGLKLRASIGGRAYYGAMVGMVMLFQFFVLMPFFPNKRSESTWVHDVMSKISLGCALISPLIIFISAFVKAQHAYHEDCYYDNRGDLQHYDKIWAVSYKRESLMLK
jgi:hypothetical protein